MTSSAFDRNLLFGILALQMDFITRDGLIDGMQAWTLAKTQSLGEVLVDREFMPQSQRDVLEQLVAAHIAQHGGDAQQSLIRTVFRGDHTGIAAKHFRSGRAGQSGADPRRCGPGSWHAFSGGISYGL